MKKHRLKLNGKWVTSAEFHRGGPVGGAGVPAVTNTYSTAKPLVSEGVGCMKAQVPDMRAMLKEHNVQGVAVRDNGQLEITSRRGRKEVLKLRGLIDNDGGYSDG